MSRLNRPIALSACAATLALLLTLVLAPWASAATPVERHQGWVDALQNVIDTQPELTAEQVSALNGAIQEVDPGDFTARIGEAERELLSGQMDSLVTTLSCQTYAALYEDLSGLQPWLAANQVVVATQKCNCGGHDDCSDGYHCKAVNCLSEVGTQNWGMCRSGEPPVETDPEPVG